MQEEEGTKGQAVVTDQPVQEVKERRKNSPRVDPIEFRDIWNKSKNITEVAEHFGRTETSCRTLACNLRQKHIMCKKFPSGRRK